MKLKFLIIFVSFLWTILSCSSKVAPSLADGELSPKREFEPQGREENARIDEKLIDERMSEKLRDFNRCFEEEKTRASFDLKRVMALFTLTKDSHARDAGVVSIHPVSEEFKDCFKSVIRSITFEPISSDKPVLVFYPVEYRFFKTNE